MSAARILVVDDEPDVEALITQKFRRQVRKGEFEFIFASDGQHALDILKNDTDIMMVLSDINMPRMDGLTLLAELNELHQELETIIISAYGDMANIRTAMNRGAFDFVTKPIEFDDLETTIAKTLSHLKVFRTLQQEKTAAEKEKAQLARHFSPNIAQALSQDPDCLSPGGERRTATFLFTDLADFTNLVEATNSDVIVELLNEYLDQLAKLIFEHDGTILKVVGDAVHAMFGAPIQQSDHAKRAVNCAHAIDNFATGFQAKMNSKNVLLGHTRIGINSGAAIIGNFGGEYFFDYTAHGDAINTAARLESVNKQLGTRICVSQSVVDKIDDFKGRPAGILQLKGKTQSLKAFEPLSNERFNSPATAEYLSAYTKLETGDEGAKKAFASLVGKHAEDPLALFHLGRLLSGENGTNITMQNK